MAKNHIIEYQWDVFGLLPWKFLVLGVQPILTLPTSLKCFMCKISLLGHLTNMLDIGHGSSVLRCLTQGLKSNVTVITSWWSILKWFIKKHLLGVNLDLIFLMIEDYVSCSSEVEFYVVGRQTLTNWTENWVEFTANSRHK